MKQKIFQITCALVLSIVVMSCAPEGYTSHESGFFGGFFHGLVLPFSLIGKLFGSDIGIYAENNSEFFYWLGFIFGIGGLGGGAARGR